MNKKTKLSKYLNVTVNIIVLVASYFYIVYLFKKKSIDFNLPSSTFEHLSSFTVISICVLILIMTFMNWFLEAIKWKILINSIQTISYKTAFTSVLIGLFTSVFIPNRTGEWVGRIFSIQSENKGAIFVHTMLGNIIQYSITLVLGLTAAVYYVDLNAIVFKQLPINVNFLVYLFGVVAILILAGYIIFTVLHKFEWVARLKSQFKESIKQIKVFSVKKTCVLFLLSIGRYIIFTLQYIILLSAFKISIPIIDIVMILALYFLLLSIIPTVLVSEIGVRGSVSLLLFSTYCSFYSLDFFYLESIVIFTCTLIWLFNIIIPSVLGSFFMYRFKLFRK